MLIYTKLIKNIKILNFYALCKQYYIKYLLYKILKNILYKHKIKFYNLGLKG